MCFHLIHHCVAGFHQVSKRALLLLLLASLAGKGQIVPAVTAVLRVLFVHFLLGGLHHHYLLLQLRDGLLDSIKL